MRREVVLGAVALLFVLALAAPALAHTEFESSDPADGESVAEPVGEIEVVFTLPVTLVGAGFEVLDTEGNILSPEVETEDDTSFRLLLPEPLDGGDVAVRFEVAAEDGHVLAGGFSFTVTAPATTTTTDSPATTTSTSQASTTTTQPAESTTSTIPAEETTIPTPEADSDGGILWLPFVGGLALVAGAGFYAWRSLRN
jgi:methionine-rich copper-binding protein CopC